MSLPENTSSSPLTIGFSPCPNDCFIFDAMIHGKVDTEGLEFQPVIEDVETLNQKAFDRELDITKLSYHAFAYITKYYQLLNSGSALGNGCGPLLIGKEENLNYIFTNLESKMSNLTIAIPGTFTTASFLLALAFPFAANTIEMNFSEIEDAVLKGDVDAGLIIHENRFTYEQKGLKNEQMNRKGVVAFKTSDTNRFFGPDHFFRLPSAIHSSNLPSKRETREEWSETR